MVVKLSLTSDPAAHGVEGWLPDKFLERFIIAC
jgi:hypothetical protein